MAETSRTPPPAIAEAVAGLGLARDGARLVATPLEGGVSSDIWRIDLPGGPVCVKRALARLRVAAEWEVPVERNASEVAWMREAGAIAPGSAPRVLAADEALGAFAMEWLAPERYPVWKARLRDGQADPGFAAGVGERLGRIHAGTAGVAAVRSRFATDAIFHDIRLEPYLLATALAHPRHAETLRALARTTAETRLALVHGDVSPKNILCGPDGPVFIDAECAWYGDPAFDLAFCLNHLLLKCLWTPAARDAFLACFDALREAYLARVAWEPAARFEARAARLLPGLLLGRVDGKSPVEYLTAEAEKDMVRRVAGALLASAPATLGAVRAAWTGALGR